MLVLQLLGTLSLRNETPPVPVSAQQKRSLGLLAILALAGRQGFSRDRIEAYLWPESSAPLARHSLDQTVYAIRHALGRDFILSSGRELRLNPNLVQVDAWEFEEAIRARQWAPAVERYKGALLDGFHFTDSREAESWIDAERARLLREYQKAVEFLANAAAAAGDHAGSVTWRRRLANSDPLSASATKQLMLALAAAGDRAGAVKQARLYQELVRQELEIAPDSEIERLAATLSNHAIAESVASGLHEDAAHDRLASTEGSAEVPPNRASALSVAAPTVKAKEGSHRDRAMLYAVIPLAILMTGAALWGWMRPAPSRPVSRYTLVVDSTEAIVRGASWSGRMELSPDGSRLAYIGGPRSHTTGRAQTLAFRAVTALFGHLGVEWNLLRTSADERSLLGELIAFYKERRDLLHTGMALRYEHPDAAIIAHGVISTDRSDALVSVARVATSEHLVSEPLRVRGLDSRRHYRVETADLALLRTMAFGPALKQPGWIEHGVEATGRQLAEIGLQLPVLHPESAILIVVGALDR